MAEMEQGSGGARHSDTLECFVDELHSAFRSRQFRRLGSQPISSLTLDQAYEVQSRVIARRIDDGERPAGYKVGCTSRAIREQFGLGEPVAARLMSPHVYYGDSHLALDDYVNCSVEAELVLRIGRDIGEGVDSQNLVSAIDSVSPGIEVHHYRFWYGEPTSQELIASNGIHACLIVGDDRKSPDAINLDSEEVALFLNDRLAASAVSAETMGGPLKSLTWLVKKLKTLGTSLKAGDLVIPGSPARLIPVLRGSRVKASVTRCGSVSVEFE
jgi:2-keto-4-pentenoate hydratase